MSHDNETDAKLRQLFADFNPTVSSERDFVQRLEANLVAIEHVRAQQAAIRRSSRMATVIASFAGFLTGLILAYFQPHITALLSRHALRLLNWPEYSFSTLGFMLSAAASMLIALGTYEGSYRLLRPEELR